MDGLHDAKNGALNEVMQEDRRLLGYRQELETLREENRLRQCRVVELLPGEGLRVRVEGRELVNFSSNDYLGLSGDGRLKEAAIEAIRECGTGSAAARLITGTSPLVAELEAALARFKGTEAALVFNSGYQANISILQGLLTENDRVFADKLNHASLVDGVLLSAARWTRYKHLDLSHLEAKLIKTSTAGHRWIVTDSVFSMDGDFPDLPALVALAEKYDALVMVDEAHATGIFGDDRSSGLCEAMGVTERVALQMGTFSKALGGAGAYVAGPRVLIDTLVNRARGFIYSTALPPATVGAALRAVEVAQSDPSMKERLWRNIARFERQLRHHGLEAYCPLPLKSPIVPVLLGENERALRVSRALFERGFLVQAIRPPTVPPGTARLRIALSAAHTDEQLDALAGQLAVSL